MRPLRSGAVIEVFGELDSTSLEAKRRAHAADRAVWIVALRQTSGYGRRGAAWRQSEGDVAATLLFPTSAAIETLPQLSFVAALATFDAIQRYAPSARLTLKWPNDVLADGKKIAGLLLELIGTPPRQLVAIGVGVNIVAAPVLAEYATARMIDYCSPPPPPRDFVETLDETFCAWRARWEAEGFAEIRNEWLGRAARLGERIQVRLPAETVEGVFRDLDSEGNLILELPTGRRAIAAGAILPPNSPARS